LFHESIDEVMALFARLRNLGFDVVAEHSGFPDQMRANSIRLFRDGIARVIVSARSLIEGFNVPSADIGIVIAASASVRQRIQTLGRLLRKNRLGEGPEKSATLFVLYARDTVDELIYEKADWERFVGAERNEYFDWDPLSGTHPNVLSGPPKRPPLTEDELAESGLTTGVEYSGDLGLGRSYSLDTQGNISDDNGNPIEPHAELRELLVPWRKSTGKFRISPRRLFVYSLEKNDSGAWTGLYLGTLTTPPVALNETSPDDRAPGQDSHEGGLSVSRIRGEVFNVLLRDRRLIARKERGRVRFVLPLEKIADPDKRAATGRIQNALRELHSKGHGVNKITVKPDGEVVYVLENRAFSLGIAPEGPSGFQLEDEPS
jgi:hypothetical protein